VSRENLITKVRALVQFQNRYTYNPNLDQVRNRLVQDFRGAGYTAANVTRQPFPSDAVDRQENIFCVMDPNRLPNLLVCAHYDCKSEETASNPRTGRAPGADDNASGVAAILEAARILRGQMVRKNILFAAFGGEEHGLQGSKECAKAALSERWPLDLVVNLDMVGWQNPANPDSIEVQRDIINAKPENDEASRQAALRLESAATANGLKVVRGNIKRSDYMPFEELGFVCIGLFEGNGNPNEHTTGDVIGTIDFDHLVRVTQTLADFLLAEAK
jgi:Zn-dependent M28 family amino/carboxypeptidase